MEDLNLILSFFSAFEIARGHQIQRKNYTDFLKTLKFEVFESMAVDTETNKGTQTQNGFWLTEASVRSRQNHAKKRSRNPTDISDDADQQVSLVGCVNISNANLIPDGRGGFFVHIQKKDILPNNHGHSNSVRRLPQTQTQNRHAPLAIPPDSRRRRHNDWSSRNNKHQRSSNFATEDLLRMDFNDRQRMFHPPPFPRDMYGRRDVRPF